MAKQTVPGRCRKVARNEFFDGRGKLLAFLGSLSEEIADKDGLEERYSSSSITLADGTILTLAMLRGDKPVLLAQCSECQKPGCDQGANGMMLAENATRCVECRRIVCPIHRRRSNRKWRCPSCHQKHRLLKPTKSLLRAIFFVRVEE